MSADAVAPGNADGPASQHGGGFRASLLRSPVALAACVLTLLLTGAALAAPWLVALDPFDPVNMNVANAFRPPVGWAGGSWAQPLGTDDQGRSLLAAILFGMRTSILVGLAAVLLSAVLGVALGLLAGYAGGAIDSAIMRVGDVQLSFPAILIALIIDGVARGFLPAAAHDRLALFVLITAIGLAHWVQFARTARGSTLVEKNKEYVQAARILGLSSFAVMRRHVLPNITGPILVIATINLAVAILNEATLSFLGVGMPPTQPSLGTLIHTGQNFLFSGEWWITLFPGVVLAVLVLAVNLLGDWLRDYFNPKLRR